MVKRLILFFIILLLLITSAYAVNYNAYQGSFSSTYLNIFRDVAENLSGEDYVAWRASDEVYCMYIGNDLEENAGTFTGGEGRLLSLSSSRSDSGSSYNTYTSYSMTDISDIRLTTNNVLVYSSIKEYPALKQGGEEYEISLILIIAIALLSFVFIRIFSWRRY